MKTKLEAIQASGPKSHTKEGYNAWYDKILHAANGIEIKAELREEEEAETIGNWNPITQKWTGAKHEKFVDLQEENDENTM